MIEVIDMEEVWGLEMAQMGRGKSGRLSLHLQKTLSILPMSTVLTPLTLYQLHQLHLRVVLPIQPTLPMVSLPVLTEPISASIFTHILPIHTMITRRRQIRDVGSSPILR